MLVRNLSTTPLSLRKGGQKFILQPGKATAVPEVLFTKEQVKAIYGNFVQVLNDDLKVIDTPSKEVANKNKVKVEKKEEVIEDFTFAGPVEEITEEDSKEESEEDDTTEEAKEIVTEEDNKEADTITEEDDFVKEIEEVMEEAKKPKKAKKSSGKKSTKKSTKKS